MGSHCRFLSNGKMWWNWDWGLWGFLYFFFACERPLVPLVWIVLWSYGTGGRMWELRSRVISLSQTWGFISVHPEWWQHCSTSRGDMWTERVCFEGKWHCGGSLLCLITELGYCVSCSKLGAGVEMITKTRSTYLKSLYSSERDSQVQS